MRLWFRKNTHQQAREAVSEYLDGRLAAGMAARLEAHLQQCHPCQDEFVSVRAAVQLVRMMPQATVPRSFALRLDQVVQQARTPFWVGWLPAIRVATAATAALFLVVVSVDVFGAGSGTTAQSTSYSLLRSQEQADASQQEKQRLAPALATAPAAAPSSSQPSGGQGALQDGARKAQDEGQFSGAAPQSTLEASDDAAAGKPSSSSTLRLVEAILFVVGLLLLAWTLAMARRRQPF